MASLLLLYIGILFYHIIIPISNGSQHPCTSWRSCRSTTITCTDNEDCSVDCGGTESCEFTEINCPQNGDCYIYCYNDEACKDTTINAQPNTKLNVTCTGSSSSITDTCRDSTINGASNTNMVIHCGRQYACYGSTIDARYASYLKMQDCATDYWTCYDLTIWCPQNVNGDKRCIIQGIYTLMSSF